jgi:hypothetical protein
MMAASCNDILPHARNGSVWSGLIPLRLSAAWQKTVAWCLAYEMQDAFGPIPSFISHFSNDGTAARQQLR